MSLSSSISNALSGLTANSRIAETISSNISNANTEGYARREVELAQSVVGTSGSGVRVAGITRHVDAVLLGNRRLADAELGQATAQANYLQAMESAIGLPDSPGSLTGRLSEFEAALIQAGSRPDSEARLQAAVSAAQSVAGHLNTVSDSIQGQRMLADQGIAQAVETINSSLARISELNAHLLRMSPIIGGDNALADERQRAIDSIAELLPIREVQRDNGVIALFTTGGAILLDGTPAVLGFAQVGIIVPDMSLGGGTLSGLTINGKLVATGAANGPIAGGRLAGLFDIRDVQAPALTARLDAVARDLIERFADPAVDPTLLVGDAGLFTDNGSALLTVNETGLAGRISLNALVDPAAGGAVWRLRDGLGAAVPGAAGDATLLNALNDTMASNRLPATGGFIVPRSANGIAGDLMSGVTVSLYSAQTDQSFARARSEALISSELAQGVDTDAELQRLLLVEQSFAANARVISTVDELIQTLLRI